MNRSVKTGIGMNAGSRFFFVSFCLLIILGISGCKKNAPFTTSDLTWKTQDGFQQQGTLYTPGQDDPPALILLHMLGGQHSDWNLFAERASTRGYMVLAYDIRGHSESINQREEHHSYKNFVRKDWGRAIKDIANAKRQLLEHGASADNLFIVGASIGANMALRYGDGDGEIQGVILLSPGVTYKDIGLEETTKKNRRLPILLIAGDSDRYSAESVQKMKSWSPAYAEMRTYAGSRHGTDLLDSDRVIDDIFEWLRPIVK